MKHRKQRDEANRHEEGLVASFFYCQAASFVGLLPCSRVILQVRGRIRHRRGQQGICPTLESSGKPLVSKACGLKSGSLIAFPLLPAGKNNPHPDAGERTDCFGVTLALGTFALIVISRPGFRERCLPRELLQGIAQWLTARIAPVGFGIGSALKDDWGAARESRQALCVLIALSVIANFCQQTGSEMLASTGKRAEDFAVFMAQKQALNFLIIGSDLLDHGQ